MLPRYNNLETRLSGVEEASVVKVCFTRLQHCRQPVSLPPYLQQWHVYPGL